MAPSSCCQTHAIIDFAVTEKSNQPPKLVEGWGGLCRGYVQGRTHSAEDLRRRNSTVRFKVQYAAPAKAESEEEHSAVAGSYRKLMHNLAKATVKEPPVMSAEEAVISIFALDNPPLTCSEAPEFIEELARCGYKIVPIVEKT